MTNTNPATELVRLNKRAEEIAQRQRALIAQLGLEARHEKIVLDAIDVADAARKHATHDPGGRAKRRRETVAITRRIQKAQDRLAALPPGPDVVTAQQQLDSAQQLLFARAFGADAN